MLWSGWRDELSSSDPEERAQAAVRLGESGKSARQAALPLARLVRDDPDDSVRGTAAWALGKMDDDRGEVINALIDALARGESVRDTATTALRRIKGDRVPKILAWRLPRESETALRVSICVAASAVGQRMAAASGAIAKAAISDKSERVRSAALGALGHMGRAANRHRPVLRAALRDPAPHTRLRAVMALRMAFNEVHVAPAIPLLGHDDPSVRLLALRAIAGAGKQAVAATRAVEECLQDPAPDVAALAAETLAKLSG